MRAIYFVWNSHFSLMIQKPERAQSLDIIGDIVD
jgi:hypothetical protein